MSRDDDRAAVMLRLDPDLHERIVAAAFARGLTFNWFCSHLLAEGLDRLIPADEFKLTREP
jgi:predicted HicB family RNase H-like nuclease